MNTKTLCLGVLILGKSSGYDIGKQLEQQFSRFMDIAASGVYPALKSLLNEGLVEFEKIEQSSLPDKKLYSITDEGRAIFKEELSKLAPRHKIRSQFILLLHFAELLTPQRLSEVMLERLKEVKTFAEAADDCLNNKAEESLSCGSQFILEYARAVMTAESKFLEENSDKFTNHLKDLATLEASNE